MVTLKSKIALFEGHGPSPSAKPHSVCTLEEFWEANQDLAWGEIRDIERALDQFGSYKIGGGAAQAFTIKVAREGRARDERFA